ncbi:prohead assembly (scaffolding) protein [Yersinia phage MHG19]|nr:prohead assembly (scaffolding) protein [Yersinia phage MHG19]
MLKEQLIAEAANLAVDVELDSIFESVGLSDEVKANFSTVFEQSVKTNAAKIAESHINNIIEKAETYTAEMIEEAVTENEKSLTENASKFFDHLAKEWMAENKLAVERGLKAELFESMFSGLKELFVEHNVVVPEESVDVVAEMEEELTESQEELKNLFETKVELERTIAGMKRESAIKESTSDLTESQKEKVSALVEGLAYSDSFDGKLNAIVEMVKASKEKTVVTEGAKPTDINTTDNDTAGLNFISEAAETTDNADDAEMAMYTRAATRLA